VRVTDNNALSVMSTRDDCLLPSMACHCTAINIIITRLRDLRLFRLFTLPDRPQCVLKYSIRLFECINYIKMFGSCPDPW